MSSAAAHPSQTLAERLLEAAKSGRGSGGFDDGEDPGVAAAEVAAWLVERVSSAPSSDAPSSSPSSTLTSLASFLDEVASCLRAGGSGARVLDAGVFDWAPKALGAADGQGGKKVDASDDVAGDRDRERSQSSSLSLAVHRLASALASHLSQREALALFSAEMASAHVQDG